MGKDLKGKELGQNLSQRKDGRYEAKYTDNFGKRHSICGHKLSAVRKKLNEALYKKEHNIYNSNAAFTLNEWFETWLDKYKKNSLKTTSFYLTISYYNRIKPYLGDMLIKNIREVHIQDTFNKINHYSKSTLCATLSSLKEMLQCAVDNGYLEKMPIRNINLKSTYKKKREDFLQ